MECPSSLWWNGSVLYIVIPSLQILMSEQGEKFGDTKKRLQARIGVSDKDLVKYRFALIQAPTSNQPSYIEDGTSVLYSASGFLTRFHRGHDLRAPIRLRMRPRLRPHR